MLLAIARFEIRYWLRGFMVWIFLLLMSAMIWGAASSDNVTVGAPLENMNRNAPYAIQNFYAISSILTLLMTVAFVNSAAARDFAHQTAQMLFSTPVRKRARPRERTAVAADRTTHHAVTSHDTSRTTASRPVAAPGAPFRTPT